MTRETASGSLGTDRAKIMVNSLEDAAWWRALKAQLSLEGGNFHRAEAKSLSKTMINIHFSLTTGVNSINMAGIVESCAK